MESKLMKYSHGFAGMSAVSILLYFANKWNILTPQTKDYWLILILTGIVCFITGLILRIIAMKRTSNSTQADSNESVS